MELKKRVLATLLFGILLFQLVNITQAFVGVSPPRYYVDFEPGKKEVFTFTFRTDETRELQVSAEGDLSEYVTLSSDRVQGVESVNVLLELPKKISVPGEHIIYIGGQQVGDIDNVVGISLLAAVRGTIRVIVPYPGKYAEMKFISYDIKKGSIANFSISLSNKGDEDINALVEVDILDENGKVLETISSANWVLDPTQEETRILFSKTILPAGRYTAVARLTYEGEPTKQESQFRVGDLSVAIVSYTKYLNKNKLNKFDIEIESLWNDPIKNVYANVSLVDYPVQFYTPSINLEGFGRANLSGYLDTSLIQEDNVRAKISVNYEGKKTEKIVKLRFRGTLNYTLIALVAGLIIASIVIILLVVWVRRLEKYAKGKK